MGEVKFTKGSEEWQMFMDYWALCQRFWIPEAEDAWWEKLIRETDCFYKKYGTEFARAMALSLVNEAERKYRSGS